MFANNDSLILDLFSDASRVSRLLIVKGRDHPHDFAGCGAMGIVDDARLLHLLKSPKRLFWVLGALPRSFREFVFQNNAIPTSVSCHLCPCTLGRHKCSFSSLHPFGLATSLFLPLFYLFLSPSHIPNTVPRRQVVQEQQPHHAFVSTTRYPFLSPIMGSCVLTDCQAFITATKPCPYMYGLVAIQTSRLSTERVVFVSTLLLTLPLSFCKS